MSKRLSQNIKDSICNRIVREKFDPLFAAHDAKEHAFANKLIDDVPHISSIDKLPEGWVPERESVETYWNGHFKRFNLGRRRRVPVRVSERGLRFAADGPLFLEQIELTQEHSNLKEREEELRREVNGILASVTTSKRLLEIWPEAEAYLPKAATPLPAVVDVERVKKLLAA